nr:DUF3592 domain-containing protein [Propionibacterium sp.]
MVELLGPLVMIVPGIVLLGWSGVRLWTVTAPRRWTPVVGRVVEHGRDAHGVVDIVEYPLPDGGRHRVIPDPHGHYRSGRPLGSPVRVWHDPRDALRAVLEPPALDRVAGPLLLGLLGLFFFVGGLFWAALIVALVTGR